MSSTPFCVMCTIVERGQAARVIKAFEREGVSLSYRTSGTGTAPSDLLDILGIGTTERDILLSPVPRAVAEQLILKIHSVGFSVHAKGILFMLPLTAASLRVVHAMETMKPFEEGREMEQHSIKQSLVLVAVDQGYTEDVMDTARQAGARGGTVIRSHIVRSREDESFGGPTFAGERELIAIVATTQGERNAIMESIDRQHGGESPAHAVLYALPVEAAAHLS